MASAITWALGISMVFSIQNEIDFFCNAVGVYQKSGSSVLRWVADNRIGNHLFHASFNDSLDQFENRIFKIADKLCHSHEISEALVEKIKEANQFYRDIQPNYETLFSLHYRQAKIPAGNEEKKEMKNLKFAKQISQTYFDPANAFHINNLIYLKDIIEQIGAYLHIDES